VISNPASVSVEEVRSFDEVFAASVSWAKDMSARSGKRVQVLLQATNPKRFKWQAEDASLASDVLFVGKTRGVFREVVDFALRAKAPLSVYGEGWHDYIDAGSIKSDFLANQKVPAAYASCSILLNDHWQDMRDLGFASNRLFDAAACGTRVLSDHIDGLDELFGGLVKTYKNYEEFSRLVTSPSAWPSDSERKRLASIVAKEHSFEARAKALIAASL
jgi:spore maturation protein CgeB